MPRKKLMTLSAVATLLVEVFLPETYQKYLFLNYKQSPEYRSYKSFVPDFLHGRPRSVIIHSLERRSKSLKFTKDDVCLVNNTGEFSVKGSSGCSHTVSFGINSNNGSPSCSCRDWLQWHIPCKHFWTVFRFYPSWSWNSLPESYKSSAYLSSDTEAMDTFFGEQSTSVATHESDNTSLIQHTNPVVAEIPQQKVC